MVNDHLCNHNIGRKWRYFIHFSILTCSESLNLSVVHICFLQSVTGAGSSHNPLGTNLQHLHIVKAALFRPLQHLLAYFASQHFVSNTSPFRNTLFRNAPHYVTTSFTNNRTSGEKFSLRGKLSNH